MKWAVLQFPGSNCDQDLIHVLRSVMGKDAAYLWHKERSLGDAEVVLVPGGFSYGDYLRCGAIARFSPVMRAVGEFASRGGFVLGICNGFQILCEAGLLPGCLIRNRELRFACREVVLRVENAGLPFTGRMRAGQVLRMPVAHGEGNYFADAETLARIERGGQVVFRYSEGSNPNGSLGDIAGVCNGRGNVLGLMPHPERAAEAILGSADGRLIFESLSDAVRACRAARLSGD
ncbi:MAG TPA: phosphoribosylformylglycinamidine synthase subunit PurQ [Verrucomicrobiae bacterium]|nr:phosphoribosylformylglycinamidine synthase subunit PurQ [Verrucomicrobiae bacterium]